MVFLKDFFEKVDFKNSQQMTKKAWKITQHAILCFRSRHYLISQKQQPQINQLLQPWNLPLQQLLLQQQHQQQQQPHQQQQQPHQQQQQRLQQD